MAFIKSLKKLTNKFKNMTQSKLQKAKKASIEWLRKNLGADADTKDKDPKNWVPSLLKSQDLIFRKAVSKASLPMIGMLYFYTYAPKHAKTLPYYDTFPCVIPINYYKGKSAGFLGINFHYLPPLLRASLLDALLSIKAHTAHNGRPDDYFKISYDYLKGFSKSNLVKPTIKRYLFTHVRSNFAHIRSGEWENAVMLPVEQFKKANKREVWKDSKESV